MRVVYKVLLLSVLIAPFLAGCNKEFDEHYKQPGWLKGSAYEVLSERGEYSMFLQAADRVQFGLVLKGQGLCTVFAPTNTELRKYFDAKGWGGVDDAPLDELSTLIGFHIVQYSFSPQMLTNYQPSGANAAEVGPAGMYYKQKTFGRLPIREMTVTSFDDQTGDNTQKVNVFMREKYLPVLSSTLMQTKGLSDFKYNFEMIYANDKDSWRGDGPGQIYAANASVLNPSGKLEEAALPADNGYVYLINEVMEPVPSIYDVMDNNPDYSLYFSMYNRFAIFVYDAALSAMYGETSNDSLFLLYHNSLPQIGSEWTYAPVANAGYNQFQATGRAFNAFAPTNAATDEFVSNFFSEFGSVSNLPLLHTAYFVNSQILDNTPGTTATAANARKGIVLPGEFRMNDGDGGTARIKTIYGDPFVFNVDASPLIQMCTNGIFYGADKVTIPGPFKSTTAPVFQSPNYQIFLNMLHKTGNILQLASKEVAYTLFVPTDEALESYGIRINQGVASVLGDEVIMKSSGSDAGTAMSMAEVNQLVDMHMIFGKIKPEDMQSKRIFPTKTTNVYVKVYDGGVYGDGGTETTAAIRPTALGDFGDYGLSYEINSVLERTSDYLTTVLRQPAYSKFWDLLRNAGIASIPTGSSEYVISMVAGESTMVFAPTNEAIDADPVIRTLSNIPTVDADGKVIDSPLASYLKTFFVSLEKNEESVYLLPGSTSIDDAPIGVTGAYTTENYSKWNGYDKQYNYIYLDRDNANFRLKLQRTTTVTEIVNGKPETKVIADPTATPVYTSSDKFPVFARDGVVYRINNTSDIQPL